MKSEAAGKVNLNMASAAELARVPGIGPERAEAIVNYRYANGLFVSVDELLNVKGIGQKELGAFRNLVTVE
jgi:competence protein ComEA